MVLFDLDGTLVDTTKIIVDVVTQVVRKHGLDPDEKVIRQGIGQPLVTMLSSFVPEDLLPQIREDYSKLYRKIGYEKMKLFPGVTKNLRRIRENYQMGIVTGKMQEGALRNLEYLKILDMFDVVVGADSTERGKPYADPILYAVEQLDVPPGEAIYVGDAAHDIHAAKNAGSLSAAVLTGSATEEELWALEPDFVFDTVGDFFAEI